VPKVFCERPGARKISHVAGYQGTLLPQGCLEEGNICGS
jgi:hypothetical protein